MLPYAFLSAVLFKTDLIKALYQPLNTDYRLRQLGIDESRDCHAVLLRHEFGESSVVADVGDVVEMADRSSGHGL